MKKKTTWLAVEQPIHEKMPQDCYNLYKAGQLVKRNITNRNCRLLFFYRGNSKDVFQEQSKGGRLTNLMGKKQISKEWEKLNKFVKIDARHKPWRNIKDGSWMGVNVTPEAPVGQSMTATIVDGEVEVTSRETFVELPVVAKKKAAKLPTPYDDAAFRKTLAANETFTNGTDNVIVVLKEVKESHSMVHFTMVIDGEQKNKRKYLKDFHELLKVNGYL